MTSLLQLPSDILWNRIVVKLLDISDLVRLEVAFANKSFRHNLRIFSNQVWKSTYLDIDSNEMYWLYTHNIFVTRVRININHFYNIHQILTSKQQESNKTIIVKHSSTDYFMKMMEFSNKMDALEIICSESSIEDFSVDSNLNHDYLSLSYQYITSLQPSITSIKIIGWKHQSTIVSLSLALNPSLRLLTISDMDNSRELDNRPMIMPDDTSQLYHNIEEIKCSVLTTTIISSILHCPNLQVLSIDYCSDLKEQTIINIFKYCNNIKSISLKHPYDQISIENICHSLVLIKPKLTHLSIISEDISLSSSLAYSLHELLLTLTSFEISCPDKDEDAIPILFRSKLPQMRRMIINICDEEGISSIFRSTEILTICESCPYAVSLSFPCPGCEIPANDGFSYFPKYCLNLEELRVGTWDTCCIADILEGDTTKLLLTCCKKLKKVLMCGEEISFDSLYYLGTYGVQLQSIELNFQRYPVISELLMISKLDEEKMLYVDSLRSKNILSVHVRGNTIELSVLTFFLSKFSCIRTSNINFQGLKYTNNDSLLCYNASYVILRQVPISKNNFLLLMNNDHLQHLKIIINQQLNEIFLNDMIELITNKQYMLKCIDVCVTTLLNKKMTMMIQTIKEKIHELKTIQVNFFYDESSDYNDEFNDNEDDEDNMDEDYPDEFDQQDNEDDDDEDDEEEDEYSEDDAQEDGD